MREGLTDYLTKSETALELNRKVKEAGDIHQRRLSEYLSQSAGYLAGKLEDNKPCPVCGSLTHPSPAQVEGRPATPEEIEKAQEEVNRTLKEYTKVNDEATKLKSESEYRLETIEKMELGPDLESDLTPALKEDYILKVRNVIENQDADADTRERAFLEKISEVRENRVLTLRNLKSLKEDLDKKEEENGRRLKAVEKARKELETLRKSKESLSEKCSNLKLEFEKMKADLKAREEHLEFKSLEEARRDLDKKQKRAKDYKEAFKNAQKSFDTVNNHFEEVQRTGSLLRDKLNSLKVSIDESEEIYKSSLKKAEFENEEAFLKVLCEIEKIPEYSKIIEDYNREVDHLKRAIKDLDDKLLDKERPDLESLEVKENEAQLQEKEADEARSKRELELKRLEEIKKKAGEIIPEIEEMRERFGSVSTFESLINKKGETLVQYILSIYFREVLERANEKLFRMTDGLYSLKQPNPGKLGVVVYDSNSESERDVKTLSGGETFMASLALALGFSEVVEDMNGGVRLDTIFIDEGFGSLDPDYLDKALEVLQEQTGNRNVAIISHVELLKERIPQQIVVTKKQDSSSVELRY